MSNDVAVVKESRPANPTYWGAEVKERAFALYCTAGNGSARATAHLLKQEAIETALQNGMEAKDAEPTPPASTVERWARTDDWAGRNFHALAQTFGRDFIELRRAWFGQLQQANQNITDIQAGVWRDDPDHATVLLKAADLVTKRQGIGTFGANQGGMMQFADLLAVGEDDEDISPEERRRRVRDRIIEENTGNG